jgi:hypothetical protein
MFPSLRRFIRYVDAIIELNQQIVPEQPGWLGPMVVFGIFRGGLVVISEATLFWKRWIRI